PTDPRWRKEKPGAVCGIASRVYPTCAPINKPIPGRPGIGAQFARFNFTNALICAAASSAAALRGAVGRNRFIAPLGEADGAIKRLRPTNSAALNRRVQNRLRIQLYRV